METTPPSSSVDTTAPNAPSVTIADGDGFITEDEITDDQVEVRIGLAGTGAEAGDTLTVNGLDIVLTPADIDAGEVVTFLAAPGNGLSLEVSATLTDAAGNTSAAGTANAVVDTIAPELSVDAQGSINDTTPVISGSSDELGATVSVVVTDANGDAQTLTAVVQADGTWSVVVDAPLAEGEYTVVASVTDAAGNTATASQTGILDITAPALSVDAQGSINDTTPVISGSSDEIGATVTVVVTDANGVTQTLTAVVQPDGTWSVEVPTALAEGAYTVEASVTDGSGNTATASQTGILDITAPSAPSVTIADGDGFITDDEIINAQVEVVIGLAGTGAEAGDTLTVNGTAIELSQANIDAGSVLVPLAAPAEGETLTVSATLTDAAGNTSAAGTASAVVDTTAPNAPSVTIADGDGFITEDEITDDQVEVRIGLAGTGAEAGDTLTVNGLDIVLTPADIDAGEVVTFLAAPGNGLSLEVSATLTDAAGNTSAAGTANAVVDTIAPELSVDAQGSINDTTPVISGSSDELGATVSVVVTDANGDAQTLTAVVQADGTWSVVVDAPLAEGEYTVVASVTDAAGNTATASQTGILDITAPALSVDAQGSINDTTPVISGSSDEIGATVTVVVTDANGVTQTLTAVVQPDGTWSVEVPTALAEGAYTVEASVTDGSGNTATASQTGILDITAPSAPSVTIADGDGFITDDEIINAQVEVVIGLAGTGAEAGDTLTVNGTAIELSQANIDAGSVLVPLAAPAEGETLTVSATLTDAAGNTSAAGTASAVVDTTAPNAPSVTIADGDGFITEDEITDDQVEVRIGLAGTGAEAGDTLTVNGLDIVLTPADIDAGEVVTFLAAPGNGLSLEVSATLTDAAGNTSAAGTANAVVDTIAPELSVDAQGSINDTTPVISGSSDELGATVSVVVTDANGDAQTLTAVVQADGTWSVVVDAPLAEGEYTVVASVTDAAGNTATASQTGILDITAPALSVDAQGSINDTTPVISGSSDEIGATVTVVVTDANGVTQTLTAVVQPDGTWSVEVPTALAEGAYTVEASVTDGSGNTATASQTGILDITAPSAPSVTIADGDGFITDDEIINAQVEVVIGLAGTGAEAGDTLTVNGTAIELSQANIDAGSVLVPLAAPAEGETLTVSATLTDAAGNTSAAGTASAVVDTTAPNAPSVTIADGDGFITEDEITDDQVEVRIGLAGTGAEAGDTLTVNGLDIVLTPADIDAGEVVTFLAAPGNGLSLEVSATLTDAAGNTSAAGTANAVVDTIAPELSVDAQGSINDTTPVISGSSDELGATVSVVVTDANGDAQTLTAVVQADGTWSVVVDAPLAEGEYTVVASVTDAAGNTATASQTGILDITAPALSVDAQGSINDTTPVISGSSDEIGATVTVVVTDANGVTQTLTAVVQPDGTWSVEVPTALAEGAYTVEASVTDGSGNTATASQTGILDITAPSAPSVTIADGDGFITDDEIINAQVEVVIGLAGTGAEAGDTLTVNGTAIELSQANIDAGSVLVPLAAPAEGETLTVSATLTDAAGNTSAAGTASAVVDTTAPNAPSVTIADGDGFITEDEITDDQVEVRIGLAGTGAEAGDTLTVNGLDIVLTPADIDAGEVVTFLAAPGNGLSLEVSATLTDAAGNTSAAGTANAVVDTIAPELSVDAQGSINDTTPVISGSSDELGATVSVVVTDANGDAQTLTAVVQADGTWSVVVDAPLAEGEYTVVASVTDAAGNTATASQTGILDITAPALSVDAQGSINDTTPVISGSSDEIGATVTVVVTDANGVTQTLTAVVQPDGTWSVEVPTALAEGAYTVEASVTDGSGNTATASQTGILDITAPSAPSVTIADGDGFITDDEIINAQVEVVIGLAGTGAEAGDTLTVNGTAIELSQANIDAGSVLVPLAAPAEGETLTVSATLTDAAGNTSAAGTASAVVDTTAPNAPSVTIADGDGFITEDEITDDQVEVRIGLAGTGAEAGDTLTVNGLDIVLTPADIDAGEVVTFLAAPGNGLSLEVSATLTDAAGNTSAAGTANAVVDTIAPELSVDAQGSINDTTPVISGSSDELGATVSVVVTDANGDAQTLTAVVQADGTWSVVVDAPLAEGEYTVVASVTDAAGNTATASQTGILDITAPALSVDAQGSINDTTPVISGSSDEIGATVTVVVTDANGVTQTLTAVVQPDGTWSVEVPTALAEGAYTVEASVTDGSGNTATASQTGILDITAPSAPSVTIADGDGFITDDEIINAQVEVVIGLAGTGAEAGDTLTVNGTAIELSQANIDAGSVLVPLAAPAEGETLTVSATLTDAAGNTSAAGTASAVVDTTAPNAPSVTIADGDGFITEDEITDDQVEVRIGLAGTGAEAGDTLTVNGLDIVLTPADIDAGEVVTFLAAPGNGLSLEVSATLTDAAGNTSAAGTANAVVDTIAPELSVDAQGSINDTTPVISGSSDELGATVSVVVTDANGDAQTLTAVVQADGTWSVVVDAPLAEGEYTVVASVTDAAGNTATASQTGILDITAPALSVDAQGSINDTTPVISGSSDEIGATVTVVVTDANGVTQTLTAVVQPDGTWSVEVPTALAEGAYTVEASVTDGSGNTATASQTGILDITAPSAPSVTIADGDGFITDDEIINAQVEVVIGLAGTGAEAGDTLTVNGTAIELSQANIDAGSVLVPLAAPAEGETLTVSATLTDAAGNTSAAGTASAVVDTTAPNAPSVTIADGDGFITEDEITDDQVEVRIGLAGTGAEAGDTLTVNGLDIVLTPADIDAGEVVTFLAAPGNGLSLEVSATLTDAAGNTSAAGTANAVVDTIAPELSVDAQGSINDTTPVISGSSDELGATVSVVVTDANGDAQTLTAVVQADGTWSVVVDAPLAEGEYTVVASVTDAAGNTATASQTGILDITAPALSVDAQGSINDTTPVISGSSDEIGATVTVVVTDANGVTQTLTAVVQPDGTWSVEVPTALAEGAYTVEASVTDGSGNTATASQTGILDITAPSAPSVTIADGDGFITDDEIINAQVEVVIGLAGTGAEAGDTLTVNGTAIELSQANIDAGSVLVPLAAPAEGETLTVSATLTDAAGNTSAAGTASAVVDTTAPNAPSVTIADGDGFITEDEITDDQVEVRIGLAGTGAEAGDTLTVNGLDIVLTPADIDAGEVVTFLAAPGNGLSLEVSATLTDAAGNTSAAGTANAVVDTIAPELSVDAQGSINDTTPVISGSSDELGATVSVVVTDANGDAQTLTAVVQADGTWSVVVDAPLAEGEYTVVASVTDAAGNTATASQTGILDITAPALSVDAQGSINDTTPVISGSSDEIGATVTVVVTDANGVTQTLTAVVQPDGTWSVEVPTALAEGAYTVEASVTDGSGNTATASQTGILDITAPSAPSVTIADGDGFITDDEIINAQVEVVIGLAGTGAEAGDTLTVNGTAIELSQANIDAGSVLVPLAAPAEGETLTVSATLTDAAGNTSAAGTASAVVDTTAPNAPSVTIADGDGFITEDEITDDQVEVRIGLAGTGAEAGDTLTVNGLDIVLTPADIDAGEVVTFLAAPGNGLSLEVSATLTDAAGNTSAAGTANAVVDTIAPELSVDAQGSINDTTPVISGSSDELGATVSVVVTDANGDAQTLTAVVQADGTWSVVVDAPLAEGEYTVVASVTDAAGNTATASQTGILDITAPALSVDAQGSINDTTPVISGSSDEIGATVTVVVTDANGVTQTLTAVVQPDGTWSVEVPTALAEGAYTVEASVTDGSGNTATASQTGILDITAPSAPSVTIADGDGFITDDEIINAQVEVVIGLAGTGAEAGDTLTVNGTAIELSQANIDAGSVLVPLAAPAEGETLTVSATLTDAAGNTSAAGTASAVVDTTAPNAPSVTIADGDGFITEDEITDDQVEVRIGLAGTGAEAGDTLTVNGLDIVLTPADIDAGEVVTFLAAPGNGLSLEVSATLTDAAGNTSAAGTANAVVDTIAPNAPSVTIGTGGAFINADDIDADGNVSVTIGLAGTNAVAGDTLTVNGTTIELTQAEIDEGSVLVPLIAPVDGERLTVSASLTDAAGNTSAAGTADAVVDTIAPNAPNVTIANGDGFITDDEIINDQVNIIISLANTGAVAGNILTVNGTDIVLTDDQITAGEVLTFLVAPADGDTLTVSATLTDAAGNTSEAGTASAVVDTTAPGEEEDDGNSIAFDDADGLINDSEQTNVTFSGTLEDGASIVSIVIRDGLGNSVTVAASDITVEDNIITVAGQDLSGLSDGGLIVIMTVTDAAGNQGAVNDTATLITTLPSITNLVASGDVRVYEAFLEGGTQVGAGSTLDQNWFGVSSVVGIASVAVAGMLMSGSAVEDDGFVLLDKVNLQNLSVDSPVVIVTAEGNVLRLTGFNAETGRVDYEFELIEAITHPEGTVARNTLDKARIDVIVTDNAGNAAGSSINVIIVDDAPVIANTQNAILSVEQGSVLSANLGIQVGADSDGAAVTNISLTTNSAGQILVRYSDPILGTVQKPMTVDNGDALTYSFVNGVLAASTSDGRPAFEIRVDLETGDYTIEVLAEIDAAVLRFLNMSPETGGNRPTAIFGNPLLSTLEFLATGIGGNVNYSANTIWVGPGGRISAGETLRLNFRDPTTQQRVELAEVVVTTSGRSQWVAYLDGVEVGRGVGQTTTTTTIRAEDLPNGGSYFDRIDFIGTSTGYSISNVGGTYLDPSVDFVLDTRVTVEDGDGDAVTLGLGLTFSADSNFVGTAGDEVILGSSGNDVLVGGAGNDVLIGGAGNDILTGGFGDDVFKWNFGDQGVVGTAATDRVTDFSRGDNVLDIADLLQGENAGSISIEEINNFVFAQQSGNNVVLNINSSGNINPTGSNPDQVIVLENYSMSGATSQQFINQLLLDEKLNIE
ncbi:hypothetical protein BWR19_17050 [Halomonas sp. 1513]|nr:Ig-like domain-containing protein [Halomonas sp. 1513]APX94504.1 hypothetical protein BWR19_17050 [Halomonas sp. 1513]